MKKYDVIVIGTGAGNIIIEEALKNGSKCALIEKDKFGGTCLTRGCIPTKVMVSVADAIREMQSYSKIGIRVEKPVVDFDLLSKRVWTKIDESIELKEFFEAADNLDVYEGTARFLENKVIEVTNKEDGSKEKLSADKIFINVGARTKINSFEGLDGVDYLTSETFFGHRFPQKPYKSIVILGGGPIGCEFAHVFSALGTKVTLVQHNVRLLPREEEEVSAEILKYMRHFGVEVILNQDTVSIREEAGSKFLVIKERTTGEEREVSAEEVLFASGVRANSNLLSLENTDIETDSKGWILTNEFLETSVEGVYALGDINGKQQFRHKANYEADILAHNLFMNKKPEEFRWTSYDLVPAVTFCYPQVAHVGLTQKEAVEQGYQVKVGYNHYYETAKGYALGHEKGDELGAFAKLIVDKDTNKMLGIHVVGTQASILIQPFLNLMNAGEQDLVPINEHIGSPLTFKLREEKAKRYLDPQDHRAIREAMVPHPTLSEVSIWTFYHMSE
ncbi:dihydrolipoyl dehydrogenase family protein [Filifactor villosus]|uniref:Dihydrolipoyl dehydrogenase family protein n=1 Tax=Filifactor villosus TaxID=29374 RepID=A0ABV9QNN0_9FIRM